MLVDFSFTNYLSFKDTATLSMIVSEKPEANEPRRLIPIGNEKYALSSFAALYGPNASGKSNAVKALMDFVMLILQSHTLGIDAPIPSYRPFRLDENSRTAPVGFEAEFVIEGIRYAFKVRFDRFSILEEELIFYPEGRRALLYSRKKGEPIDFGSKFIGKKRELEGFVRKNALFLSTAVNLSNEVLKPIYKYFQTKYQFHVSMDSAGHPIMTTTHDIRVKGLEYKKAIMGFLNAADISVVDVDIRKNDAAAKSISFSPDMPNEFRQALIENLQYQPFLGHAVYGDTAPSGKNEYFDLNGEESGGTVKMYELAGEVINALATPGVLVVDEFNSGLHPQLSEFIIGLFRSPTINPKGAQLIITSHDTNLMSRSDISRDELWIVDRNARGASELYSINDFSKNVVRKGTNLEKWYLDGRFKGIPSLDPSKFFMGEEHA